MARTYIVISGGGLIVNDPSNLRIGSKQSPIFSLYEGGAMPQKFLGHFTSNEDVKRFIQTRENIGAAKNATTETKNSSEAHGL